MQAALLVDDDSTWSMNSIRMLITIKKKCIVLKSTNAHGQRREAFPFHRIQHRWDGHTNLDAVHAVAATISKGPVEDGKMHCHAAAVVIKWLIINLKTGIRHGFNARGEIQVTQHRGILGQLVKCFFCYSSSAQVEPPQLEVGLKKQTLLDPWWCKITMFDYILRWHSYLLKL